VQAGTYVEGQVRIWGDGGGIRDVLGSIVGRYRLDSRRYLQNVIDQFRCECCLILSPAPNFKESCSFIESAANE
jgi:hypothetical protein